MMNNYDRMLDAARRRFLEYDLAVLARRPGVTDGGAYLATCFFGQQTRICKADGTMTLDGKPANFEEGLAVYDWFCDRKPGAAASEDFCPVSSLPGVYVGGSGLSISPESLANAIDGAPAAFERACAAMGAGRVDLGDLGFQLCIFPDLPMCLKFYFGDEEFPPSLTLLWDRNTLQFVRYETIYYIAGCLAERLTALMEE